MRRKYLCSKKQDHYIRDCAKKKRDSKDKAGNAVLDLHDSSNKGYHNVDLLVVLIEKIQGQWVLDSGCSLHMSHDKRFFHDDKSNDSGRVLIANHNTCNIVGISSVKIRMHDGIIRTLKHVRHVPRLKKNLISLGMLDSSCYLFKSE